MQWTTIELYGINYAVDYKPDYDHERGLFEHSRYGEGFLAMADHVSDMTDSDRMVFEQCAVIGNRVLRINGQKLGGKWDDPSWIARRLKITFQQARNLIDCWDIIELKGKDRGKSFSKLYQQMKNGKVLLGIGYIESLAKELAFAEAVDPNDALENDPAQYDERRVSMTYRRKKSQTAEAIEDIFNPAEFEEQLDGVIDATRPSAGIDVKAAQDLEFAPLGEQDIPDWLSKQPKQFQMLMAKLEAISDIGILKSWAKQVYGKFSFTFEQGDVFWKQYDRRKRKLAVIQTEAAALIVKKIKESTEPTATIGRKLYEIQKGIRTLKHMPLPNEWEAIWNAYRARKGAVAAPDKVDVNSISEKEMESLLACEPA
jgi:hypothetical protein